MITFEKIGNKIKELRSQKGLTQNDISDQLSQQGINISRETFNKIENGNRSISVIELNAICKVLNVTVDDLVKDLEENNDLVTLFRKGHELSEEDEEFLDDFQLMARSLIAQEKIYHDKIKRTPRRPLWKGNGDA
ncbi:helix-turn-helix transcriptional regulator [Neobacillus sp. YIM B06451]|uniref:helix-turn-helix domain-containing protein n=1 Tax=Neobacillus sp. YIM B06451 TaxID=3070994 RepID=UPI002930E9C8|nr:helix-turn-helix transcriptional regulator [Neobacillus sp. YIM B06451]